ncbi:pyrimidine-specific ribonucleoside hydrolase [Pseudonocardia hierapolitana]|uniref:Pyrimidine-specific ribonucleoside hydrolase n=1 Tax=Pseudonocardia hierapolitana TaxID=1128676 RepID=A0A561SVJ0_9PSEU|nr:nucleoside hydrolase [Pseudonocardia hierapolitana]TWF78876.1 pyrimidine-specific ribonucleoside hydrolase [Pseudonocardia hierapolitana]
MSTPIVIDTDPGVDDAVAIMLALASPEVELKAVTTVFGNVPLDATTANAGRLLALCGRADVPLAVGAARPLVHPQRELAAEWHGNDGLGGRAGTLPAPVAPGPSSAVELLADVLRASDRPVTLVPIGPLTNIALLLAVHPELAGRIERLVWMGGSLGAGNTSGVAEFNAHCDPEAAHRVLTQADVPVTMVPLDLTLRCPAGPEWIEALAAAGPRCAALAGVITHYRAAFRERYGIDAVAVHDAVAVLEAVLPGTLRTTPKPIAVACDLGPARGATVGMPEGSGPPVQVALDADTDKVLAEILERLRRLG